MTIDEQWRPIPGWDGYEISNLGRVMSYRRPNPVLLKPGVSPKGYRFVRLYRSTYDAKTIAVHRLMLETFVGPRPDGMETRHLDGDNSNNALSNLVYGTRAENIADACAHAQGYHGGKTHCPRGHAYDEANTRRSKAGRLCRTCYREHTASWRRKRAEAKAT